MQLYNTMTRKKEVFVPHIEGKVSMYACGITAYDLSHIGHARSAVVFDMIARYLRFLNYDLTFVRNFTDVDDKIINKANQEGIPSQEVAEKYIKAFHEDMDRLGVQRADIEPKATESIGDMIALISRLIEKGHAYATPTGDVNFRVRSFASYGKLSGRDIDEMRSGARVSIDEQKEDPLDFALWKSAKPNEPYWESPWGKGRPGWHIECSAMSERNLPLPLDIHGGGQDLIFPHHENEIAQSEAALDQEFAHYWVHNGFVQINSEKMSKSLGNFKTIRDILEQCQPEVLRFFLLTKHYRSPIDFSFDSLEEAAHGLKRIYECVAQIQQFLTAPKVKKTPWDKTVTEELETVKNSFFEAMDDDFNTAAAIGHIFSTIRLCNRVLETKNLMTSEEVIPFFHSFLDFVTAWQKILGILTQSPKDFLAVLRKDKLANMKIDISQIETLLAKRQEARTNKDYPLSDKVRDELNQLGITVKDTASGQEWDII